MLSQDVAANVCTKSSSFWVASTAPSVLKTRGAQQAGHVQYEARDSEALLSHS